MIDSSTSQPPTADTTPESTAAQAPQGASSADMLTQSEWTRRLVAVASVIVVGLSTLIIVCVLAYRVFVDGNSALTNDITTKLALLAVVCILSMVAALFGSNSLIAKAIDKVIP